MSSTDKAIGDVIDSIDPFAANHFGILGKLTEPLPQECHVIIILSKFVWSSDNFSLGNPLLKIVNLKKTQKNLVKLLLWNYPYTRNIML